MPSGAQSVTTSTRPNPIDTFKAWTGREFARLQRWFSHPENHFNQLASMVLEAHMIWDSLVAAEPKIVTDHAATAARVSVAFRTVAHFLPPNPPPSDPMTAITELTAAYQEVMAAIAILKHTPPAVK
jgi:hypothetical protein